MTIMEITTNDIERELKLMAVEEKALGTVGSGIDDARRILASSQAARKEIAVQLMLSQLCLKETAEAAKQRGQDMLIAIAESEELSATAVSFFRFGLRLGRENAAAETSSQTSAKIG